MMKTLKFLAAVALAVTFLGSSQANARTNDASASANASATIVVPIAISSTGDLNFAEVAASGVAGTVVMSPAGLRSSTGGASLGNSVGASAASFSVIGQANATYAITLPTSITLASGSDNMTVDVFTSNPSVTGALNGSGQENLAVGATLEVGANQPTGNYLGSFAVTVAYN